MEKDYGVGMVGVLSSYRQSSKHTAAVVLLKKQAKEPATPPKKVRKMVVGWFLPELCVCVRGRTRHRKHMIDA